MRAARRATAGDLALVESITLAAYAEYTALLDQKPLPVTEDYAPRIAAGQVWLVADGGQEVGLAVLEEAADHLLIFSLAVLPGYRGGVGRWLLDFAEARAREAGLPELRLFTNARMERNIGIYIKAGFVETGRHQPAERPGWTLIDMARPV